MSVLAVSDDELEGDRGRVVSSGGECTRAREITWIGVGAAAAEDSWGARTCHEV